MADRTPPQKTVTARGNFQVDTDQFKFGSASGLSDATTDYLEVTYHSDFESNIITFECFLYVNNLFTETYMLYDSYNPNGGSYGYGSGEQFYITKAGTISTLIYKSFGDYDDFGLFSEVYTLSIGSLTLTNSTWHHLAFERNKTTRGISLYFNGTRVTTGTENLIEGYKPSTLNRFLMAARPSGGNSLRGWTDEIRASNLARYNSSTYTVPTEAFSADNNTILLLHCEGAYGSTTFTDDITIPSGATSVTISGEVATATASFEVATIVITYDAIIAGAEATAIARFLTPNFGTVLIENPNFSYLGKTQINLTARNRSEFYFYSQR